MSSQKKDLVHIIRRLQTVISIVLFFIIFFFCWDVTEFKIVDIQLSKWGSSESETNILWNSILVVLSISTWFNTIFYIKKQDRIHNKIIPYGLFSFVGLCLFIVGSFSMEYFITHNVAAYLYFFLYPLAIFIMAYLNRKTLAYKEWFTHLMISTTMVVAPLIFIGLFKGMAITEIVHSMIVCYWNLYITFKKF